MVFAIPFVSASRSSLHRVASEAARKCHLRGRSLRASCFPVNRFVLRDTLVRGGNRSRYAGTPSKQAHPLRRDRGRFVVVLGRGRGTTWGACRRQQQCGSRVGRRARERG